MLVYDWDVTEEPEGTIVAKLCGTQVVVFPAVETGSEGWCWEVRFADGQIQAGLSPDPDDALEKAKKVAERFLP